MAAVKSLTIRTAKQFMTVCDTVSGDTQVSLDWANPDVINTVYANRMSLRGFTQPPNIAEAVVNQVSIIYEQWHATRGKVPLTHLRRVREILVDVYPDALELYDACIQIPL